MVSLGSCKVIEQMFDLLETPTETPTGSPMPALPAGFESMAPGAELAVLLAGVDRERLSGFDRVELLKARSRLVAHVQSERWRT